MSSKKRGQTLKEVMAARGRSYADAAEAYAAYSGTALPPAALDEALWYERLRRRMVAARKARGLNQGDVAQAMTTSQSEISRLETSLGPGTRLGTLRGYVATCDTTLESLLAEDGPPEAEAQAGEGVQVERDVRLSVEDEVFLGSEAVGIVESLHAINNLLRGVSIGRDQRKDMILGFLDELSHVRGGSTVPLWNLNVTIPVLKDAPAPGIEARQAAEMATWEVVSAAAGEPGAARTAKAATVSEERFREAIARPLNLADF